MAPVRNDSLLSRRNLGIKVLDTKTKKPAERRKEGDGPKPGEQRRSPGIARFAAMPEVKQPSPSARTNEQPTQKPVLKLPTDVIKGGKSGRDAPLQKLAEKVERDRKAKESGIKTGKGTTPTGTSAGGIGVKPGKRRGRPGEGGEEPGLADMASVRADRNKGRKPKSRGVGRDEDDGPFRRRRNLVRMKHGSTAAPRKGKVALTLPCSVRTFSEAAGVSAAHIPAITAGRRRRMIVRSIYVCRRSTGAPSTKLT